MKRVLIFHTAIGLGHKKIAENIGWQLQKAGYEVKIADIGQVQSGKVGRSLVFLHHLVNAYAPIVWSWLYKSNIINTLSSPFRVKLASLSFEKTLSFIEQFQPDLIITTQTSASAVLSYLKQKKLYTGVWAIAFSDFHLHPFWLYNNADFYLANIKEQKDQMVQLGFDANKIYVCGITLQNRPSINVEQSKAKLNIKPDEKVVLVVSGSLGTGFNSEKLLKIAGEVSAKFIVVCGKNEETFQRLSSALPQPKFLLLGFVENMQELYAIAEVFLSKPGGLSTSEAQQWDLPMLVTHWLPGQEELNYKYLTDRNLIMPKTKNITEQLKQELVTGSFKQSLIRNPFKQEILDSKEELLKAIRENI